MSIFNNLKEFTEHHCNNAFNMLYNNSLDPNTKTCPNIGKVLKRYEHMRRVAFSGIKVIQVLAEEGIVKECNRQNYIEAIFLAGIYHDIYKLSGSTDHAASAAKFISECSSYECYSNAEDRLIFELAYNMIIEHSYKNYDSDKINTTENLSLPKLFRDLDMLDKLTTVNIIDACSGEAEIADKINALETKKLIISKYKFYDIMEKDVENRMKILDLYLERLYTEQNLTLGINSEILDRVGM